MELKHTTNPKTKLLNYPPKATSTITFHNQIPIADKQRFRSMASSFSGLIVSIDKPIETRGRAQKKGASEHATNGTRFTQDPTSLKMSCIGHINMVKLMKKTTKNEKKHHDKHHDDAQREHHEEKKAKSKQKPPPRILKIFGFRFFGSGTAYNARKSGMFVGGPGDKDESSNRRSVPSLGQKSLYDFECMDQEDEESKQVRIPYSAPILLGSEGVVLLQPRREINLWQRRKTPSPPPLQV